MKDVLKLQLIETNNTNNYAEMTGSAASLGCDGEPIQDNV